MSDACANTFRPSARLTYFVRSGRASPMLVRQNRELRLHVATGASRPAYLSAASGLVRIGNHFYVVADDELHLGVFPVSGNAPGHLLRILQGDLPGDPAERKKAKPDFEALTILSPLEGHEDGALLVLGSGSKQHRRTGVLIPIRGEALVVRDSSVLDLAPLYRTLSGEIGQVNVEGAVVYGDRLLLLHRGNKGDTTNAIAAFSLPALLRSLEGGIFDAPLLGIQYYQLGAIGSVPLAFTDGAVLPDGRLVFCAVAEDTADSYHDGPTLGAIIGVIEDGEVSFVEPLMRQYKVEGIHAEQAGSSVHLWFVTDADDPSAPAALLSAELQLPRSG
jgi:hypothetical protein